MMRVTTLFALHLLFASLVAAATLPPEIAATAPLFPENTRAVVACHLSPEVREWMFSSFFFSPTIYRKVLTEQSEKFAKATGFNPLEDVEWDVLALSDAPPGAVMIATTKKDGTKVLETLEKDPKAGPQLKLEQVKGTTLVRFEQFEVAVRANVFALAPAGMLKPILERNAGSPSNAKLLEQIAASPFTNAQAYALAAPTAETMAQFAQHPSAAPFGGAVLARVKQVAIALDPKDVTLALKLDAKDAATVAADQLKGLITSLKGALQLYTTKPAVPADGSPLDHIDPKIILTRILAQTGMDALTAATVTADGEVTRLTVPKDKVPLMHAEGSTLFIMLAAAAGATYGSMQAKAAGAAPAVAAPTSPTSPAAGSEDEKAQCHAIQQRLTAAVELYNTDKKKKAKLEEIADQLVAAQYLESKPDDPGQPAGSFADFVTAPDGRVTCKVHGSPDAGEPTDRERAAPDRTASPRAERDPSASPSPAGEEDEEAGTTERK